MTALCRNSLFSNTFQAHLQSRKDEKLIEPKHINDAYLPLIGSNGRGGLYSVPDNAMATVSKAHAERLPIDSETPVVYMPSHRFSNNLYSVLPSPPSHHLPLL